MPVGRRWAAKKAAAGDAGVAGRAVGAL